jgi:hypothetical protein
VFDPSTPLYWPSANVSAPNTSARLSLLGTGDV